MASGLIDHTRVMKPHKTQQGRDLKSSWVGEYVIWGEWHAQREHGSATPLSHTLPEAFHLAVPGSHVL